MNRLDSMGETLSDQRERAADTIDQAADAIRDRAESRPEGRVREYSGTAADKMNAAADYIRNHDANAMWRDVEKLVRRYPGEAITAALVLGMLAGRSMRRD